MIDERVRMMVQEWTKYAQQVEDPFLKFMIFYMCLDSWMTGGSNQYKDSAKKAWLKKNSPRLLEDWTQYRLLTPEIAHLASLPGVLDMRDRWNESKRKNLRPNSNFGDCLDYIYQIRCNLFHGEKIPIDDRDLDLVSNAWPILEHWIALLIES